MKRTPLLLVATSLLALTLGAAVDQNWTLPALAQPLAAAPDRPGAAGVDPVVVSRSNSAFMIGQTDIPAEAPVQTRLDSPTQLTAQAPLPPPVVASGPDETALRYFAQQGDTVRLQREIERLRALYPNWQPPTDPLATDFEPDQDIIAIWNMVAAGDYAGARAAIAAKQDADPGFVATTDLLETIGRGEAGAQLRTASEAGDYQAVVSIAASQPQLLTCASVDNLWRLAEAFIKSGNRARGLDAYVYVLTNCTDAAERFATMQKAMDVLDGDDLATLLKLGRPDAQGKDEFAPLRLELARRAVAAALEAGGTQPKAEDVTLLADAAEQNDNAADLRLLGYLALDRGRASEAKRYFEAAFAADPSTASAEGLGVALLQLRDPTAAEDVLADFRDDSETIGAVYRDAAAAMLALEPRRAVSQDVLARVVGVANDTRDAGIAQELGWYAYAYGQPQTAMEWFETALSWQSDLEPAAYGAMIAANALGNTLKVEDIRRAWGGRSVRIAQFGSVSAPASTAPLPRPRPAHLGQQAPVQTVRAAVVQAAVTESGGSSGGGGGGGSASGNGCRAYQPPMSLSPAAALTHAWCLMDLNRPAQAVDHFARALDSASVSTRSDAAYGRALAFLRLGLPDEAAVAAATAPLTNKRAIELEIAILTQKATSAYGIGEYALALAMLDARSGYAPERNDLLTLRAWSYFHLKRYREAERIFKAVAATGYGDAVSGLEATRLSLMTY